MLARATLLDRVFVSNDTDLLQIANACLNQRREFSGLIFARQMGITIGKAIDDLELIARVFEPEEMRSRIFYIPV